MLIDLHGHTFTPGILGAAGPYGPEFWYDEEGNHHVRIGAWQMNMSTPSIRRRAEAGERFDPEQLFANSSNVDNRIKAMDENGFDMLVLSLPFHSTMYFVESEIAVPFAQTVNNELAAQSNAYPDRLKFWAHLPLQDIEASVAEGERAVKELGAVGFSMGGSDLAGREADDEIFFPIWEKAVELGVPFFVHGHTHADRFGAVGGTRLPDPYERSSAVGFCYDEAMCFYNLVCGGVLDEFPDLRVYITHGGGYVPYQLGRFEQIAYTVTDRKNKRKFTDYLDNFYFDLAIESQAMRRAIVSEVGADRLLHGSNFGGSDGIWQMDLTADVGLDEAGIEKVRSGNAKALLKL
jgi:predicted TIM-barrel fold metal-dependent hydrolase